MDGAPLNVEAKLDTFVEESHLLFLRTGPSGPRPPDNLPATPWAAAAAAVALAPADGAPPAPTVTCCTGGRWASCAGG